MILRANCKINIGLDIVSRRDDGYHDLESIMFPVEGLYDVLTINKIEGSHDVRFRGVGIAVDCPDEQNLVVRAARLMQSHHPTVEGVDIELDKRVPFGAGLGGGSSDATAVIVAINDIFELGLTTEELIERAAEIGSDTPFFVRNSAQMASGRGEILEPIELDLRGLTLVLIKPEGVNVSTREAYSGITPTTPQHPLRELVTRPITEWQSSIKNDFEPHIFRAHPTLAHIKSELLRCGALYASMSGSGSTIYGLFDNLTNEQSEQLRSYSPWIYTL